MQKHNEGLFCSYHVAPTKSPVAGMSAVRMPSQEFQLNDCAHKSPLQYHSIIITFNLLNKRVYLLTVVLHWGRVGEGDE